MVSGTQKLETASQDEPRVLESKVCAQSEHSVIKESSQFEAIPTFDLCNISGGKFNLKRNYKKNSKSNLKSDIGVGKNSPNTVFRGENFNGISILSTPTKRKPENATKISVLRKYFDDLPANYLEHSTADQQFSESPAKRRKWGGGQGGVRSVTPGS